MTCQPNVVPHYRGAALTPGAFAPVSIANNTVAVFSYTDQIEACVDRIRTRDNGADLRRSKWMAAAQTGDAAAYRALLRDCIPFIESVARRRCVSADRIDDVVQEVLLTIHSARHTYDPRRSFTAWLYVIADRRAIDLLRRVRSQKVREVYAPLAFETHADQSADPTRGLMRADVSKLLSRAIGNLPERQRQALQHLLLDERSVADTAALTQRTAGSLKVNLHRAIKSLRHTLKPWA